MMETKEEIITYANCKDVAQKTDITAIIISIVLIAAGLYLSLVVTVDNPSSSLNIFRIVAGWVLVCCGVCGAFFRRTRWVYVPSGSSVKRKTIDYTADELNDLRALISSVAPEEGLRTSSISRMHLDYYASGDGEYVALQVLQYGTFNDQPLTPVISLYGSHASDFLRSVKK